MIVHMYAVNKELYSHTLTDVAESSQLDYLIPKFMHILFSYQTRSHTKQGLIPNKVSYQTRSHTKQGLIPNKVSYQTRCLLAEILYPVQI